MLYRSARLLKETAIRMPPDQAKLGREGPPQRCLPDPWHQFLLFRERVLENQVCFPGQQLPPGRKTGCLPGRFPLQEDTSPPMETKSEQQALC